MFFDNKNRWNPDVNLNFENFEFWTVPISKFALVRITVYQFYNLKLKIYMVFTEKFEFLTLPIFKFALVHLVHGSSILKFKTENLHGFY